MHELKKKFGKVLTSKFVGTGPSSYEIKNLPGRGLTKVEKHCSREANKSSDIQEISRILWNPNFHYHIHLSLS